MSGVTVEVSARKLTVPYLCPCCCSSADAELAVSFTRVTGDRVSMRRTTREFDFPYCSRCLRHARRWDAAWRIGACLIGAGLLAGIAVGATRGAVAGLVTATLSLAVAVGVALVQRARARAARTPACACAGPAVALHGWNGNAQVFAFASRRYAAAFADQNQRSLVNVTSQLFQLMEQQRAAVPPPPGKVAVPWPQREDRAYNVVGYLARVDAKMSTRVDRVKRTRVS